MDRVVRDGETGKALIAGTNVFVGAVLEWLAAGGTVEGLLERHPELTRDRVVEALRFAAHAVDREPEYGTSAGFGAGVVRELAPVYGSGRRTRVVDAEEYDDLLDSVDLLKGVYQADREIDAGLGVPHEEAMAGLRARFAGR